MTRTTVRRTIDAPVDLVFQTISDIRNFSEAVPWIVGVQFLSEQRMGVGTRFRETRRMGRREAATELEVTEYEPNDRIRLVADSFGTVWDSLFTVRDTGGATELQLIMDARPYGLLPRLMVPLMRRSVQKGLEKDMDAVKRFCEET